MFHTANLEKNNLNERKKQKKKEMLLETSLFCGAERARTVDLLRDRQAF